jgi:transcriptional regulator with XRE-family HTH domain
MEEKTHTGMDDFAARLLRARREAGWSQVELGRRSDLHGMLISKIERGHKRTVNTATLTKLAVALGVSADWLLGIEGRVVRHIA